MSIWKWLAAASLVGVATAGNATVTPTFAPGTFGFQAGDTQLADFDTTFGGVVLTGAGTGYYNGLHSGIAAPPEGDTTDYLAVLNGGSATFTFAGATGISFDVGSVDDYNSLMITLSGPDGPSITLSGSQINDGVANGDQHSAITNGRLTISGGPGDVFTTLTLSSTGNSFEIDNLALRGAVPESATWAMFLVGFGAIGSTIRRRRTSLTFA